MAVEDTSTASTTSAPGGTVVAVDWEQCESPGCTAARAAEATACLAHLEASDLDGQLRRFGRGRPLEARGVLIGPDLWRRIVDAAPDDGAGAKRLSASRFDGATIEGPVTLDGAVFRKNASFQGTRFVGPVSLARVVVNGQAQFSGALFEQGLTVSDCRFEGATWFVGARFGAPFAAARTKFWAPAWFTEAAFAADARFEHCEFENSASFARTTFLGLSGFSGTVFGADVEFENASFGSSPTFDGAAFKGEKGMPHQAKAKVIRWWGPPLASWFQRVRASLVDSGVVVAIVGAGIGAAFALNWMTEYALANAALVIGPLIALIWTWRNLVHQGWSGQTLGKRVVGLRLLSERDRRPVGAWRSVGRSILHLFDTLPLFLGWLRPLWHPKNQTFADSMTATVVVVVGSNFVRANTPGAGTSKTCATC